MKNYNLPRNQNTYLVLFPCIGQKISGNSTHSTLGCIKITNTIKFLEAHFVCVPPIPGIEVGSFSLLVLPNPYLSTSGIHTELDKRALFPWTFCLSESAHLSVDRIEYIYFLGLSNLSQLLLTRTKIMTSVGFEPTPRRLRP
jgi:hypothetical protein